MTTSENTLDDDNTHVQELRRLFLLSSVDENNCLNRSGLFLLCEKLKLSDFAVEIIERVLCGSETVDFLNFKERFVSYLPEIIDVSSGTVDPLVLRTQNTAHALGFSDPLKLTRYETRLLCENTQELEQLSVVDINALFERADTNQEGRISVQQFLTQYRLQKRLSAEVHFIADSYVTSLNLFEAYDPGNIGTVDSHDLLEQWNKAGLRIDEGLSVLKDSGQPMSGPVNPVYLSGYLESELSHMAAHAPVAVKAAVIALHNCIDHLRCSSREGDSRCEHLHKQLQLANQRRTLLLEELEQNQISIEQGYETRLRETEERYRTRLIQMEDKFRKEKREIQNDLETAEEELSRLRQQDVTWRNKSSLLERQTNRLNEENREHTETIGQLEQLNRQLRNELSKVMQPRPVEDNTQLIMWKQKVDLLVAHNKRLREKIQELSSSVKKKSRPTSDLDALNVKWSVAFKNQVAMIRKRRLAKGDSLSEMDSEPESIFVRHRRRRPLKKKERRKRYERIAGRILTTHDSDDTVMVPTSARRDQQFAQIMEEQLAKLREDHKKELMLVRQTSTKTLTDSLKDQEKQYLAQLDRERRQFETKMNNEKNQLERSFAEEKMKLMTRLQDDFDTELKRIAAMVGRSENAAAIEQYKRQVKMLESSLEGQKNGYEKRLSDLRDKYMSTTRNQSSNYHIDKNTTNFISLIEKYKAADTPNSSLERPVYTSSRSSLGVEKRPAIQPFQRSLSSVSSRCERCEQVDNRLREIYHTICGEQVLSESGIEDIGSSAGSQSDDKATLKREIRKLKGCLEATKEKVTEMRVVLSLNTPSRAYRHGVLAAGENVSDWRRGSTRWSEMTASVDRLESEKVILEARLSESQQIIKTIVDQYKQQLDETSRLGTILREVYKHPITQDSKPHIPRLNLNDA